MLLGTTDGSVVVCVCVVNLMSVCETPTGLLCGASPPHEATVKHEIMARAQISQDDGKDEQLQAECSSAARTTAQREVRCCSEYMCPHLLLFHTGSHFWKVNYVRKRSCVH